MGYFLFTHWDKTIKECIGASIYDGEDIQKALQRMVKEYPKDKKVPTHTFGSQVPNDKLRNFPLEMYDVFLSMEDIRSKISDIALITGKKEEICEREDKI